MNRADIRRHARTDRRNDAQSPYKHKAAPSTKSSEGGFWSFIKSWSIFGGYQESNSDPNGRQPLPGGETSTTPSTTNQERIYNDRAGSVPRIPGAFEESIAPAMTLESNERAVSRNASRIGRPLTVTTIPAAGPRKVQAPPLEAYEAPNQIVPAIAKERQKAQAEPNAAYAPPHDKKTSNGVISGTATVRHTAAGATTLNAAEQRDGAISSDNSKKSSKSLIKRSSAPPTTGSSKAETSESDEQQSPITNNGLPPFRGGGLELNSSVSTLNDPNMEYGDPHTQEMVAQWDRNTFVLRRALNINYEDIYEPGAWEELARYKGLKSPTPPVDQKAEERNVKEQDWQPAHLKDYNAGYTPTELMVNPYERISAFHGRHRKPIGLPSKKLRRNPSSLPQGAPVEQKNNSSKAPVRPLPPPKTRRAMGVHSYVRKSTDAKIEYPLDGEAAQPPTPEDYTLPGVAPNGSRYLTTLHRSAGTAYVGVDGDILDGPIEPALKRPKFDSSRDVETTNLNRPIVVDDMVEVPIEAPPRPQVPKIPSVILNRHKLDKQKKERPKKKLPAIPHEAMRPRHSLHSPVKPSPLRNMSKFIHNSPEMRSEEIEASTRPQERAKAINDKIPSYDFAAATRPSRKMDPLLSSPTMVKAKQQAMGFKPYEVPSYSFRQILRQARLAVEPQNGVPKPVSKAAASKGKATVARHTSIPNTLPAATASKPSSVPRQSSPLKSVLATASPATPPKPAAPAPLPASGGFNWAAAGLKMPVQAAGSWTCGLCGIVNKSEAQKCLACETARA